MNERYVCMYVAGCVARCVCVCVCMWQQVQACVHSYFASKGKVVLGTSAASHCHTVCHAADFRTTTIPTRA